MEWIFDISDPLLETIIGSVMIFLIIILLSGIMGLRSSQTLPFTMLA